MTAIEVAQAIVDKVNESGGTLAILTIYWVVLT